MKMSFGNPALDATEMLGNGVLSQKKIIPVKCYMKYMVLKLFFAF